MAQTQERALFEKLLNDDELYEKQPERLALNFKSCSLTKDDVTKLTAQLAKTKHNLKTLDLNLSDNNFEKENFVPIIDLIRPLESLEAFSLNLTNNFCDDVPQLNTLFEVIAERKNIQSLAINLKYNVVVFNEESKFDNLNPIGATLRHLRLNLSFNEFDTNGYENLMKFLEKCTNLEELNLNTAGGFLNEEHVGVDLQPALNRLAAAIAQMQGLQTLKLNWKHNVMKKVDGIAAVMRAAGSLKSLKHVHCDFNLADVAPDAESFANYFSALGPKETLYLDLGQNNWMKNNMGKALTFLANNPNGYKQLTLRLSSNLPDSAGIADVGRVFEKQENLETLHLDLGHNNIQDAGIDGLTKGLAKLPNLHELNLNVCQGQDLTADSICKIFEMVATMPKLTRATLNIKDNDLSQINLVPIQKTIATCEKLEKLALNLQDTELTAARIVELLEPLSKLPTLSDFALNLKNIELQTAGVITVITSLATFKNLSNLVLDVRDTGVKKEEIDSLNKQLKGLEDNGTIVELKVEDSQQN